MVIRAENQRTVISGSQSIEFMLWKGMKAWKDFFLENDCGIEKSCIFAADFEPRW